MIDITSLNFYYDQLQISLRCDHSLAPVTIAVGF